MNIKAINKAIKRATKAVIHLLHNPYSIKFVPLWIRSLLPGHTALSDQVPWITFKAREWLDSYLKPYMYVFEYGSGGSTIFLSRRVNKLISIEHDKGYYSKVSSVLSKEGISNCEYVLSEPEKNISGGMLSYCLKSYTSTAIKYTGMGFENYVKNIEKYPDGSFDLVIVDGRARSSCIPHTLSKIRPGGYLMLDNSERHQYQDAVSLLADYKRIDFFGIGPYYTNLWQTSVWRIEPRKPPIFILVERGGSEVQKNSEKAIYPVKQPKNSSNLSH